MILALLSNDINTYLDNSITFMTLPTNKSWLEIWLPCICTVLGCIISAIAIAWTTSKQIHNTSLLFEKTTVKEELQTLRTTLAKYIAVIRQDSGQLRRNEYINDEHKVLEASLTILLDENDDNEKLLLSSLKKFHTEKINDESECQWINELQSNAKAVIKQRKKL